MASATTEPTKDFHPPKELPAELFSKENTWYRKDITGRIPESGRKLLEEYSRIKKEDVDAHIYQMRDVLWDVAPYPCIGEFKFVNLHLPNHPSYPHVLEILKKSPPEGQPAPLLLDLGCCVAQELRSLVYAGIPSQNLYGTDINPHFLATSYTLFNDASTFKGTLVPGDITSPDSFKDWEGKFDVIFAGLFLHLFSRNQQIPILGRIMRLLKNEKGAIFLGMAAGCRGGGERGHSSAHKAKFGRQFLHDENSFKQIWEDVAELEGMKGQWRVEGGFKEKSKEDQKRDPAFFTGDGIGWVRWSCERI